MAEQIDIIATRILLESQQATKALTDFDSAVGRSKGRVEQLAAAIKKLKTDTGRSTQDLVKSIQAMNAPKGAGQFGNLGLNNKQIADAGKLVTLFEQQAAQKTRAAVAAERAAAAEAKQAASAALPKNVIPQFVQKNFGNINDYIAQSSNKIDAWKRVVTGSARAAGVDFEQAGSQLKKMVSGTTVAPLNTALKQLGDDGRSSFQKLIDGAHFARIALGALVSMLLFQGVQAVTQFFQSAIKQARDFEATLYRLANVERILSLEGIDISLKGMKKGIEDIQTALPIFSKEDVAQLVGSVSTTTKELRYTEEEILKLAAAVGILNINSTTTETLLQTQARVTNSLLSPQAKSIGDLGLSFGQAKIEAKAFEMQILKTGESFKDLTEKEKQQIKLQIVFDTAQISNIPVEKLREEIQKAGGDFAALNEYLKSNDARLQENSAAFNDLKVAVGQFLLPFLPTLTGFLDSLAQAINGTKLDLINLLSTIGAVSVGIKSLMSGNIDSYEDYKKTILDSRELLLDDFVNTFFKERPEGFEGPEFDQYFNRLNEGADTATAAIDEMLETAEDTAEAEEAMQKLADAIEEVARDAQDAREDLAVALQQKKVDIGIAFDQKNIDTELEAIQKSEDAVIDYNNKVADINLDAQQKIADAKRKAREDELKAERDLLQKLKELRQRFLMDLEEALHERDARQVLRLIKEYQFDKQNIIDRKKLEDQERAAKLAADLRNIEIERQQRLESAAIDLQRKLADIQVEKQRELEENLRWRDRELAELATWHARELEEIDRHAQQKLERLIANYAQEYGLHQEQQEKIHQLLLQYFGANMGLVSSLMAYMSGVAAQMGQLSFYSPIAPPRPTTQLQYGGRYAEGGAIIADKPTAAIFGEAGRELATFTPLDKGGQKNPFGDLGGTMGGKIKIEMLLSPDLEARITENTLNKTADIVTRVTRSR